MGLLSRGLREKNVIFKIHAGIKEIDTLGELQVLAKLTPIVTLI